MTQVWPFLERLRAFHRSVLQAARRGFHLGLAFLGRLGSGRLLGLVGEGRRGRESATKAAETRSRFSCSSSLCSFLTRGGPRELIPTLPRDPDLIPALRGIMSARCGPLSFGSVSPRPECDLPRDEGGLGPDRPSRRAADEQECRAPCVLLDRHTEAGCSPPWSPAWRDRIAPRFRVGGETQRIFERVGWQSAPWDTRRSLGCRALLLHLRRRLSGERRGRVADEYGLGRGSARDRGDRRGRRGLVEVYRGLRGRLWSGRGLSAAGAGVLTGSRGSGSSPRRSARAAGWLPVRAAAEDLDPAQAHTMGGATAPFCPARRSAPAFSVSSPGLAAYGV